MAENSRQHRFARAAGRAARAFQESQAADRAARRQAEQTAASPSPAPGPRVGAPQAGSPSAADTLRKRTARWGAQASQAAGEAARDFRRRQAADDARLAQVRERAAAEDEERLQARRAERERALDARDAAEAGLVHPLLRVARLWWTGVAVLIAGLGGAFLWYGERARRSGGPVIDPLTGVESIGPLGGATGQFTMGALCLVLALMALWGVVGLMRRRRAAVSTLTFLAVLLVVPALLRPNALFLLMGLVMAIGAVLVWLPPVRSRLRR
ncbi:hypothetical protein [Micrococcus sp.]|uniref:hypothetical protein n=1 Tax=Micrococcus sp. TaxID=1271 RepID=UPI002A9207E7|nr:hypothetical protein [Micrococcus sp.]MDY6055603.1 hypothetical protein [Micrococcus sp.]